MTLVVDASVIVALLVDSGPLGHWADEVVMDGPLFAPHLLPAEVANVLRRSVSASLVSAEVASLAHAELLDLPIELLPFGPVADRAWELRRNVTTYDAWYAATAEVLDAPLATLDRRLARTSGPTCSFLTPPRGT